MEPVERPIDPADPDGLTQVEEAGSLSDFAAKYGSKHERDEPDDESSEARPTKRGKPEDHQAIAALTKRRREAEASLGVDTARKPGETDRVYGARLKAEAAELTARRVAEPPAKATAASPVIQTPSAFTDPEPTIDQFKDATDPYSAWQRALNKWDRKKDEFEAQAERAKGTLDQQREAATKLRQETEQAHAKRVNEYRKTDKDYDRIVGAATDWPATPIMQVTLVTDPEGPKLIRYLAEHREVWDDLFLDSDGKIPSRENVEAFRRRLKARMPAGTGSAHTPENPELPPPPPNPVRTGRTRTSSESAPNPDNLSMDQFEKAFPGKRARRH